MESENNDLKRIFSGKDLAKLIFPLVIELMLTLLVGMIDSVMVSSAGEAAVSGVSLVDTVFQLLIYIFSAVDLYLFSIWYRRCSGSRTISWSRTEK